MFSFPYGNRLQNPFFECIFLEIVVEFFIKIIKKGGDKKSEHARRQTDRIRPISSSAVAMFWTVKTQIPVANASKTCPQNDL